MNKQKMLVTILFITVFVSAVWSYMLVRHHNPKVDEKAHYAQIIMFTEGNYSIYIKPHEKYPRNAMFPGYHLLLSITMRLTGLKSPDWARFIMVLNSFLVLFLAYINFRIFISPLKALVCAMQIYFLPNLFPFHFLIYTDAVSVSTVLLTLYFMFKEKYLLCAISALMMLFVRHHYIVLVPFFPAYIYFTKNKLTVSTEKIRKALPYLVPFIIPCAAFTTFIVCNGRLTLDDPTSHVPTISIGNTVFFLLLVLLFFFPIIIFRRREISEWAENHKKTALSMVTLSMLCAFLFTIRHHWNTFAWLLHNEVLAWFMQTAYSRFVMGVLIVTALLFLFSLPLVSKPAYLIYIFGALMLVPILLIEPRYSIIPLILLNIFRKKESLSKEILLMYHLAVLGIIFHYLQSTTGYML